MRRRSRSEAPPQTPWSMRLRRAYSRHGSFTGHSAHMRLATSTPTPSLGKNVSGGISLHFPCCIHSVSITPPSVVAETTGRAGRFPGTPGRGAACVGWGLWRGGAVDGGKRSTGDRVWVSPPGGSRVEADPAPVYGSEPPP